MLVFLSNTKVFLNTRKTIIFEIQFKDNTELIKQQSKTSMARVRSVMQLSVAVIVMIFVLHEKTRDIKPSSVSKLSTFMHYFMNSLKKLN